jgi:hypothetical protein
MMQMAILDDQRAGKKEAGMLLILISGLKSSILLISFLGESDLTC